MSGPRRVEALVIGDELLDGRVTDTNSVRLARALESVGLALAQRTTITDDIDIIVREARTIIARGTELCIVSGGLGPTGDDVTAAAMAKLAGTDLERDATQLARVEERLRRFGRTITENQRKQADRPRGAELVSNARGTAPGFALVVGGCRFVSLPGVPAEFDAMLDDAVITPLMGGADALLRRVLCTFGLIEAEVDARLEDVTAAHPDVRFGYRVRFPEIHVSLSARVGHDAELDAVEAEARTALGHHVFGTESRPLAAVVIDALRDASATVALGESCTGGLVADLITDVPGSSDVLLGGIVAYTPEAKVALLQVPAESIETHGVVSRETAVAMAEGAKRRFCATYGLGVTGIAGPSGGTPETPVGTIHVALAGPQGVETRALALPFERRRNKMVAAYNLLDMLRRSLASEAEGRSAKAP